MKLYAVLRRSGWPSTEELEAAAARSSEVGEQFEDARWIRSYVMRENDEAIGTVCLYEATSPQAIRDHASRALLPVDEVLPVVDTVVVRPDPAPAEA